MRLLILGILFFLPAFFSAGEVALLRLRPITVQRLLEEGASGAQSVNRLQRRLRRALMASQLGVTIALISLGWIGRSFGEYPWTQEEALNRFLNLGIFSLIVVIATILSGLLPKALVLNRPEKAALQLSPLLEAVMRALTPILALLEALASILLRLLGLNARWDSLVPALSLEELETLVEKGGVTGLRPDERNILEGVFALRDTQVREVMVPRSGMVTLPVDVNFAELMKAVHRTKHARFLITGNSLDDIRGVIDLRQLAEPISKGVMQADTALAPYLQPATRVLETSTLAELLILIRSGEPLLLVEDEHGGTEGLVTAADLTGEIVGDEIPPNNAKPELQQIEGNNTKWSIAGSYEIIELNRKLKLELPEADDHHTLAGFLLDRLQHIPIRGEVVLFEGIKFEITAINGPTIKRVLLTLNKQDEQGE